MSTPPIQDPPSTHAALGAAAATVREAALGDRGFALGDRGFTMTSTTALEEAPRRSFGSFSAAAVENAESRIQAGIHFRSATGAGLELGRHIGEHVFATNPRPVY